MELNKSSLFWFSLCPSNFKYSTFLSSGNREGTSGTRVLRLVWEKGQRILSWLTLGEKVRRSERSSCFCCFLQCQNAIFWSCKSWTPPVINAYNKKQEGNHNSNSMWDHWEVRLSGIQKKYSCLFAQLRFLKKFYWDLGSELNGQAWNLI